MVVKAISAIDVIAEVLADGRQSNSPFIALVIRHVDTIVATVGIDAGGIHHILIARGEGNVKQARGLRDEGVASHVVTRNGVADHPGGSADVKHTVNRGHNGTVAESLHFHSNAFNKSSPSGTLVGGVPQARIGSGEELIARNGKVVDKRPIRNGIERRLSGGHQGEVAFGINGIDARTDEAVVVTLLAEAIVFSRHAATVAGTHINETVSVLGHAADHKVKAT